MILLSQENRLLSRDNDMIISDLEISQIHIDKLMFDKSKKDKLKVRHVNIGGHF